MNLYYKIKTWMTFACLLSFMNVLCFCALEISNAFAQQQCVSAEATSRIEVSGALNANTPVLPGGVSSIPIVNSSSTTTYNDLATAAMGNIQPIIYDGFGASHQVLMFFFRVASNTVVMREYVDTQEIDPAPTQSSLGLPRQVPGFELTLMFDSNGLRSNPPPGGTADLQLSVAWSTGSGPHNFELLVDPITLSSRPTPLNYSADGSGPVIGNSGNMRLAQTGSNEARALD